MVLALYFHVTVDVVVAAVWVIRSAGLPVVDVRTAVAVNRKLWMTAVGLFQVLSP